MPYESKPKNTEPLKDTDLMPSGKWQGTRMIDVPAKYLLYVYENGLCSPRIETYILDNLSVIKEQIKKEGL